MKSFGRAQKSNKRKLDVQALPIPIRNRASLSLLLLETTNFPNVLIDNICSFCLPYTICGTNQTENQISVWDLDTGSPLASISSYAKRVFPLPLHGSTVSLPSLIITTTSNLIKIWDLNWIQSILSIQARSNNPIVCALSPPQRYLSGRFVVDGDENGLHIWEVQVLEEGEKKLNNQQKKQKRNRKAQKHEPIHLKDEYVAFTDDVENHTSRIAGIEEFRANKNKYILSWDISGIVKIWDITTIDDIKRDNHDSNEMGNRDQENKKHGYDNVMEDTDTNDLNQSFAFGLMENVRNRDEKVEDEMSDEDEDENESDGNDSYVIPCIYTCDLYSPDILRKSSHPNKNTSPVRSSILMTKPKYISSDSSNDTDVFQVAVGAGEEIWIWNISIQSTVLKQVQIVRTNHASFTSLNSTITPNNHPQNDHNQKQYGTTLLSLLPIVHTKDRTFLVCGTDKCLILISLSRRASLSIPTLNGSSSNPFQSTHSASLVDMDRPVTSLSLLSDSALLFLSTSGEFAQLWRIHSRIASSSMSLQCLSTFKTGDSVVV